MTEPLDPAVFGEMRELMDDALGEFIETYLDNSPKLITSIESALATGDAESIFHNAHQLKGGSGSIGAMQLADVAMHMEKIGKAGSTEGIAALLEQLKAEYARVADALKAEL
ncbi:MAG: Hpt domain-containing protein [Gammaproteobacteria bacterium]|nr:Hpt domain-containing protein [Gammaproteobacteria bacterium]